MTSRKISSDRGTAHLFFFFFLKKNAPLVLASVRLRAAPVTVPTVLVFTVGVRISRLQEPLRFFCKRDFGPLRKLQLPESLQFIILR